jgi:predicted phage terminase large subunit-like protein
MTSNVVAPYKPLPWQVEPFYDRSPVMLLTGSAGGGKSRIASEKVNAFMLHYPGARGLLIRKAREYASKSMVMSMKRAIGSPEIAVYRKADLMFQYANGSLLAAAGVKDEDQREALRSIFEDGGVDIVWIEEANALSYEAYQEIRTRMRGQASSWRQIILTTNPGGPAHWIKRRLIDGGEAKVYVSSAEDNPHNPPDYLHTLNTLTGLQYERLVRGKWVASEGALWSYDLIERQRTTRPDNLTRIVVAVDPAATNKKTSDETGIVIAGTDANGNGYVLQDVSLKASPAGWAQAAIQAYHRWQANVIVVETNNGGDMVEHTIHSVENVPVKQVRASRGKHTRAEPIAALYENGRIFHAGTFHDLEDQLTTWTPGDDSPDRLDALVWAMTELMITGGEVRITVNKYA